MSYSSPQFPSSFDPAIHLHSEGDSIYDAPPEPSFSDDLIALHAVTKEAKAEKTRQGIVIQHRNWKLADIFYSDGDGSIDTPLKRKCASSTSLATIKQLSLDLEPVSSPPSEMAFISSPVAYPPSSSPGIHTPRKRRKVEGQRSPLQKVDGNAAKRTVGGFILDDSDSEGEDVFITSQVENNKRKLSPVNELPISVPETGSFFADAGGEQTTVDIDTRSEPTRDEMSRYQPPSIEPVEPLGGRESPAQPVMMTTASGKMFSIRERRTATTLSYEELIASRSSAAPGKARRSYYGIDIHQLMDEAAMEIQESARKADIEAPMKSVEQHNQETTSSNGKTLMWTEKYRAKKFTDLVGDERTHRSVLKWLKSWDPIVFPGSSKPKPKSKNGQFQDEEQRHRKVLMLTGPPGLGKTTLAHVCARQAGYEVQEINASDERSRDIVKGRVRDMVGTENVRGLETKTANGKIRKAGRPVCVVIDEVDGVVGGSGGSGEGGFIKALIDLINLDQRNASHTSSDNTSTKKKKGDKFRMLRPIILICNDVYHPSLRPLRQSTVAEIIHVRKPALSMVISRMQTIFQNESIPCDGDGVRRLCEATWGVANKKEGGTGSGTAEGDIRGVMVVGEWVARRLRSAVSSVPGTTRLTRKWVEDNIINDLSHGGGGSRGLGRGGAKEVVERVFMENAGFPKTGQTAKATHALMQNQGSVGVAESSKRMAMDRLNQMIMTSGDVDRIVMDSFTAYPTQAYQDDNFLSKPNQAYEWLHFHDTVSSTVHGAQGWEMGPYLSQSTLAFHHLFASTSKPSYTAGNTINSANTEQEGELSLFSGPSAPYAVAEAQKANRASLSSLHSILTLPLTRTFHSPGEITVELLPYVLRMLTPDVKPVIINTASASSGDSKFRNASTASVRRASEKALVLRAVNAMAATGVRFDKTRVEYGADSSGPMARAGSAGWIYRMEPPLDTLGVFETLGKKGSGESVRYAVRQVLDMEWKKESARMENEARNKRGGMTGDDDVATVAGVAGISLDKKSSNKKTTGGVGESDKGAGDLAARVAAAGPEVKRDFFGRVIKPSPIVAVVAGEKQKMNVPSRMRTLVKEEARVWVSFNEGYSNAVRKPLTIAELMRGL